MGARSCGVEDTERDGCEGKRQQTLCLRRMTSHNSFQLFWEQKEGVADVLVAQKLPHGWSFAWLLFPRHKKSLSPSTRAGIQGCVRCRSSANQQPYNHRKLWKKCIFSIWLLHGLCSASGSDLMGQLLEGKTALCFPGFVSEVLHKWSDMLEEQTEQPEYIKFSSISGIKHRPEAGGDG